MYRNGELGWTKMLITTSGKYKLTTYKTTVDAAN